MGSKIKKYLSRFVSLVLQSQFLERPTMTNESNIQKSSGNNEVSCSSSEVPDYHSPEKWFDIASMTLCNYSNMIARLQRRHKYSDFILVYYSIFIIVNGLTIKFFPAFYNGTLSSYLGLIFSIVMLAFSLVNSSARYSQRIDQLTNSINALKTLKREINPTRKDEFLNKLSSFTEQYYKITDYTELRSDMDFFRTIKQHCESNGYTWRAVLKKENLDKKECKPWAKYLLEVNPYATSFKIFAIGFLELCLALLPIAAIVFCFIFPESRIAPLSMQ